MVFIQLSLARCSGKHSCWQQCRIDMHAVSSAAFTERQKGLGALFFSQAFSWRAALVPVVFPLPDPQSLPSWGTAPFCAPLAQKSQVCSASDTLSIPSQSRLQARVPAGDTHVPFSRALGKQPTPYVNWVKDFFFFCSSFHSGVHLGKDGGSNPCAVCKPGTGMGKWKGKFTERHSWWLLLCHSEKSLTSPTDTQSFTCFRHTSFLVHTVSPLCCLLPRGCEQVLGQTQKWFSLILD